MADHAVHVTFAPSLSTVYPTTDGFRDSVSLRGVLDERATVTIKVYSSAGSLKRMFSLGWKATGTYAATWNGRTATGSAVAAGKYRLVEVRGHGFSDREHPGTTSLINPTTHAIGAGLDNCMYDQAGTNCGIPASKSYISSTHQISALVWMTQAWGDAYDLHYLRLTYQYAVWA